MAAGGLLAGAGIRGLLAWCRAASRVSLWLQDARPLRIEHSTIAAFEVDSERPLMALAGVIRPRLIVTRGLMAALSEDELASCVTHELGHWHAWDNLKRLAMRASPDVLFGTSTAQEIARRRRRTHAAYGSRWPRQSSRSARCTVRCFTPFIPPPNCWSSRCRSTELTPQRALN